MLYKEQEISQLIKTISIKEIKIMKKLLLFPALALLTMSTLSFQASAEEQLTANTESTLKITADESAVEPLDPINVTRPVKPIDGATGATGTLTIDYVPSIDFQNGTTSTSDESYYANATPVMLEGDSRYVDRPNYVQITDKRTGQKGWSLALQQQGQFVTKESSTGANDGKELTNASLHFSNTSAVGNMTSNAVTPTTVNQEFSLDPNGTPQTIVKANSGTGGGTWITQFGIMDYSDEMDTMYESIRLDIPGTTVKEDAEYTTSLLWTLNDTP